MGSVTSVLTPVSLSPQGESINERGYARMSARPGSHGGVPAHRRGGAGPRGRQPPRVPGGGDRGVGPRRRRQPSWAGRPSNALPLVAPVRHSASSPCGSLRRGQVRAAALTLLSALLATVHVLLVLGQGVHDRADAPLPGDHPGGRPPARPPAARRHDGPVRPLGDDRHPPRGDRGPADALVGPPRLAAPRGHDDHPRGHRGGRAPARRRHRARDGRGARPGGAPGARRTASSRRAAPSSSASPTSCPTTSRAPS